MPDSSAPLIAVVLGTRPEIIKLAPVIRSLQRSPLRCAIVHSNQHYTRELDAVFFDELGLPPATTNLEVGSGSHGVQIGRMLERMEAALQELRPAAVVVQGDTNTVLAGALTASKLQIRIGHVEAGLRSFDRRMPEEVNRVVADHLASWLYAPTQGAVANLAREGIEGDHVVITGNTAVDALHQHATLATPGSSPSLSLEPGSYLLLTLHRAENTDDARRLESIVEALETLVSAHGHRLVFPIHPRTERRLKELGLLDRLRSAHGRSGPGVILLEPVGYLEFVRLQKGAMCVLTDSGGVQEESCVLGVPCVTLRDNTERPETVEVGANLLAGASVSGIVAATGAMIGRRRDWLSPFGDGRAGERIVAHLEAALGGDGASDQL